MKALDAAAVVLQDAGGPLHYREITERIRARQLWPTAGKTPWDSVNARIAVDIKELGAASRFVRTSPGHYALNPELRTDTLPGDQTGPEAENTRAASFASLSFTDAAEQILDQCGDQEPLHYAAITQRALDQGLLRTEGRTPAATMYAMVLTEIRRQQERGETPRFVRHGRGMVGLAAWLPGEVAGLVAEKNREVRQALLEHARSATPADFENLVGILLAAMGFEDVAVTSNSSDRGIDVRGTLVVGGAVRIRMAVQAKRWKGNVQAPVVQQVRGSLGAHEQGLIITTSDFSRGAKKEAERPDAAPVALIAGEQLAALLAEHQVGARVESYELYTLDENVSPDD
ncbi:MAG: HTH domain-containing protein [Chloroflexi bacterium]|nr:HTH domain-containing protein [Chloroflexota bacterium]